MSLNLQELFRHVHLFSAYTAVQHEMRNLLAQSLKTNFGKAILVSLLTKREPTSNL
jgi:hypothetical protein